MTQPPKQPDEAEWIDGLLDELAGTPLPDTPDDLMARVLGDGQALMPPPGGPRAPVPWWRQVVEGIGGWTAVGGLVAAAATGFVVGLGGLDDMGLSTPWVLGEEAYYDSLGTLDAFGWDMEEG
ncbi:hypothetical protein [uncultured Tateyamaria sp.]|uniref:hypothetical protein n=1 Tax=uncultured Tateyamaria sp. TaxID=455651 RepID=UPI002608246F|nr:hypothetical protein [uncultured Tateyamaria sp.]